MVVHRARTCTVVARCLGLCDWCCKAEQHSEGATSAVFLIAQAPAFSMQGFCYSGWRRAGLKGHAWAGNQLMMHPGKIRDSFGIIQ